jgi:S-adenosylmethionine hydrolase
MSAPVFLFSDFGLRDVFVGVMRAVIADLAPRSPVHDLLHEIPPQDLAGARLQLAAALDRLPAGAVLCAVVDPGVGSDRRGVIVRARRPGGGRLWAVAPNNGLLSPLLHEAAAPYGAGTRADRAWTLVRSAFPAGGPGTTFDGRDLFAPAAARLARGDAPTPFAMPVDLGALKLLPAPAPREDGVALVGRVAWIDRFGNLVSDLPAERLPGASWTVFVAGRRVDGPAAAFADVEVGEAVAYLGSLGTVEIALRDGDAAGAWNARAGAEVRVVPR